MKPNKLFQAGCNLAPDYGFFGSGIEKFGQHIKEVELTPLRVTGSGSDIDYEWNPPNPNAFGVYLRYTDFAIEKLNLNPSEWIADFSSREVEVAEQFKSLVMRLLTAYMSTEEKESLYFELIPEQDATERDDSADRLQDRMNTVTNEPESQVTSLDLKKVLNCDELAADLEGKWKDIKTFGYSKNYLNDGRAEQWQLFVTPLTEYLMLDDGGDISEYTYYNEADAIHDVEILQGYYENFTEI